MNPFLETLGIAGGIGIVLVVGIMVLTLFFRGLAWFSGSKPDTIAVRGVLKKDTLATVHLNDGQKFESVRFIGFTNSDSMKTNLPFELNGMVILEDEQKTQYLIRAKNIRMIVVQQ